MANNTVINQNSTVGDTISDDQITTLNGATIATGEKVQRVKIAYGAPANATDVNTTSGLPTKEVRASTSSVTSPAVTTSSSTALASNTSRLGAIFWNDGSAIVYLKLGATASATSYTIQLDSGEYYELPFFYTGIVDVITASGTATLRVTELS